MRRRDASGGDVDPIPVLLSGHELTHRPTGSVLHGHALRLGHGPKGGLLFVGEPKGHCHAEMVSD